MTSVDVDWDDFNETFNAIQSSDITNISDANTCAFERSECSSLYISTKTVIAYLKVRELINLQKLFWSIPIIDYYDRTNGIVKKQIKLTSSSKEEVEEIEKKLKKEEIKSSQLISNVKSDTKQLQFKYVQKVNIGICKKDIISRRMKEKGAFYNCFVVIIRVFEDNIYKEINLKLFNTGKMEIPGIQKNSTLYLALNELVNIIQRRFEYPLIWDKEDVQNVLINSNFNCGYCVNRENLYNLLLHKYKLHSTYDPCSYPGIQCKFYYDKNKTEQDGVCNCEIRCTKKKNCKTKNNCVECSFMIFRTGSVLIVGHCNEEVLNVIYLYLKKLFQDEIHNIYHGKIVPKKIGNNKHKIIKRTIICDA
jgi:TATA-box binding protein (TBP) (component of TFIID and TFIIIB)